MPADPSQTLVAPFTGTVVATPAATGDHVAAGAPVVVIEAMKMEHEIVAERDATVTELNVRIGETVEEGQLLATLSHGDAPAPVDAAAPEPEATREREDLAQVHERHELGLDHRRPDAVAKRHALHRRTARENLNDLLDDGSFVEYGPLMFAAQEQRRSRQELIERTPADGLVGGRAAEP